MHVLGILASIALVGAAAGTALYLDRDLELGGSTATEIVYLPPADLAKVASLGHQPLLADYFWMQALQYYGNDWNRQYHYRDLHRFLDLVIDLDPDFRYAYEFGAVSIPLNTGGWKWVNVRESTRIIERGLERFPDNWKLWMQLGFNRGVIGDDLVGAAEAYRRAAAIPAAPRFIPQLVTRLYTTAGVIERARAYAEQMLEAADHPDIRASMEKRLAEIEAEEMLQRIDAAIARFREERGAVPSSVEDLQAFGYLDRVPEDPLGGEFYVKDGEARSTSLHGGRLRVFRDEAEGERK